MAALFFRSRKLILFRYNISFCVKLTKITNFRSQELQERHCNVSESCRHFTFCRGSSFLLRLVYSARRYHSFTSFPFTSPGIMRSRSLFDRRVARRRRSAALALDFVNIIRLASASRMRLSASPCIGRQPVFIWMKPYKRESTPSAAGEIFGRASVRTDAVVA